MNILIIGAGVLGSTLAHALHRGGNEVTLLARGKRFDELKKNNLVIRHVLQFSTTKDNIKVVDSFGENDVYDLVFVVVRREQLDALLPQIWENQGSQVFMMIGNNLTAKVAAKKIEEKSCTKKKMLFGFQISGGRREPGRVVSIHTGFSTDSGYLTFGSLDHDETSLALVKKAFSLTNFKLEISPDMDAWLKCHAAIVLPICFAVYYCQGDLRKAVWNRVLLNQVIDSMDEALKILQICGISLQPPDIIKYVGEKRAKFIRKLQFAAATPIGKLAASDHAMGAKEEMRRLYEDFLCLKEKANIITPHWDELEKYMIN